MFFSSAYMCTVALYLTSIANKKIEETNKQKENLDFILPRKTTAMNRLSEYSLLLKQVDKDKRRITVKSGFHTLYSKVQPNHVPLRLGTAHFIEKRLEHPD